MNSFTNITFDEIEVGRSETVSRRMSQTEVEALALVSGDIDNFHLEKDADPGETGGAYAHAVGAEALVTGILCRRLPGPGTTVLSQALEFNGTIRVGDELTATVTALEKNSGDNVVVFDGRPDSTSPGWTTDTVLLPSVKPAAVNVTVGVPVAFSRPWM